MHEQRLAELKAHGQQHLLQFWDELDASEQDAFASQLDMVDMALMEKLFAHREEETDVVSLANDAKEPPAFCLGTGSGAIDPAKAIEAGLAALKAGEVAIIPVAGGQGTRLGFEHPKGMYPVGPVSGATLFQIHVEKTVALAKRHGVRIPFCVMTSPATHDETVAFLDENDRFGLDADDLMVFCQGTMPAVDESTGKLLLASKGSLALSPDGHGGMLAALEKSGTLATLEQRGIKHLFYFQIDNPLVDIGSPEFLGYHILSDSELSSEVVRKQAPLDRVGNVVQVDGRLHVIEYSDLPEEAANRRNDDGSLAIWAGSIAIHVMDLAFLRRMADSADSLPFHVARKKIAHVNDAGEIVKPSEPNGIKFERFIFDLLPQAKNAIVVEVDPRDHFAPLKNASGAASDTPETVREGIASQHRRWLQAAGVEVSDDTLVEICPLYALDEAEVKEKFEAGTKIDSPTYWPEVE